MFKIRRTKDEEPTAPGQVRIKKKSSVPGVMITQFVEELPERMSTPDFTRKPIALTIQEGKIAIFKAIIIGNPTPTVTWMRNNGEVTDPNVYKVTYDTNAGEHHLQIPDVSGDHSDTYKCLATNEYGKAVVTATLNVIEVGYKKNKALQQSRTAVREMPEDFKKNLKTRDFEPKEKEKKEIDERFWELLMSAEKKDYEGIYSQYGVTDFRGMLKKLSEKKKEREDQQSQVVERLCNLKPIAMKDDGGAEFEIEMSLKDPTSKIFLFKDGIMIPFNADTEIKHGLKQVGKKFVFSINSVDPEDAGMYQVEVNGVKIFSTDLKMPNVDFLVKIQEVTAVEREDAVFACVISHPMTNIKWTGKNAPLEQGDKFDITVSEDMLIHTLVVKDCKQLDKGIYAAAAGMASCCAWLIVEVDNDQTPGKKKVRKTTRAGGGGADLIKIAQEQQAIIQKEREEMIARATAAAEAAAALEAEAQALAAAEAAEKAARQAEALAARKAAALAAKKEREAAGKQKPKEKALWLLMWLLTQAELVCKLSSADCEGIWYKEGQELTSTEDVCISKEGALHKLIFKNCKDEDTGKYRFEADGRKTEAMINVEDPPRINSEDLEEFSKPSVIKIGQNVAFEVSFEGREPMKIQWFIEDEEVLDDTFIKIEKSATHTRLRLTKCQRKISGEVKIRIKNECGTIEAVTQLNILDKPTPPQGPMDIIEGSASCIEFKWRPPKDNGGCPITDYIIERQQIGRNSWKKLGKIGPEPKYRDIDAGTKAYPGPPSAPKIISAFKDCINMVWSSPSNTGGTNLLGYNVEKRKNGSNLWSPVNPPEEPIRERKYGVKDVVEGIEYEFRVSAVNISGAGEASTPSEFVFARDPKKPPGHVIDLKVTDSTYTTLSLAWSKPREEEGVQDEAKGYFVELRPAENTEWSRCNSSAIIMCSYTIMGLKSMAMYWVRVKATNEGGDGETQELDNYIIAMPPPVRPKFTDQKMKSFNVVRAGNSARINVNFEASPVPKIMWLKDAAPVSKRVTVSNSDNSSQLIIPLAERTDTGVYTILVKNIVGQETFSFEIRVTDDPKPPGTVELDQNVSGTVTVSWTPSPDEKRDDRLHYIVTKRDSAKRTWQTVAERLFNNKFTAINIMAGTQYNFRVYAKNDMGLSKPSDSASWEVSKIKEKFTLNLPESKGCSFDFPPSFTVPLKMHTSPETYECYMSCAVTGNPKPSITWVGSKDNGEYTIAAHNSLGRVECSTKLTVKVGIKKKSKVPGVMITQFVETIPEGKSHPDFTRKPIALTIQEGKLAFFKAIVIGEPKPLVTWSRNNGDVSDPSRYNPKYDPVADEHIFEEKPEKKEGEIDPKFWELLLSAEKKDYERICTEFGITDFRWMLKKLNEMKKEREEEQAVDGEMVPYTKELGERLRHSLKITDRKYIFSIRDLLPDDAGLYQVDVENVNVFSTDFKIPPVEFLVKIQEVSAVERQDAVFEAVLTNPFSRILWFGKNQPLEQDDKFDIEVSEDKLIHRLVVKDSDKDARGKKSERKNTRAGGSGVDLAKIAQEQQAKLDKVRGEITELRAAKAKEAKEAVDVAAAQATVAIGGSSGNAHQGEHSTQGRLTVGDMPVIDADDLHKFSRPVIVRVGQNAAFKMPFTPQVGLVIKWIKDGVEVKDGGSSKIVKESNHSRLLLRDCLRTDTGNIKIVLQNQFGAVEAKSNLIVLDRPGPPDSPVEIVESTSSLIEIAWKPPLDDGGSGVTNYIIERQQAGQSLWTKLGDVSADKTSYRDRNVTHGKRYNYRIFAENPEGLSDGLDTTDSIMAGIIILSGPPGAPTIVSASKTCITLTWTPPVDDRGVPIIGYQLEKRKKDTHQWIALNPLNEPIEAVSYVVKEVTEGAEYEFRVTAINESGAGEPSPPSSMVCAKNPNTRPCFKDPEDFIVVRAGNSVRVKVNYEGEPPPEITWLRDDEPISSRINVINTEGMSQLVIPSSKRSDSAIYTIKAKNSVGEVVFDIEVRVTDEPKSPGPVEIEQTVDGKVVLSWAPSPDEELDDRLYYVVARYDSNTRVWRNIADRIVCHTHTANNIIPGREYHFRVFAKNDMGLSDPSDSPTWGVNSDRVPLVTSCCNSMQVSFERPPSILVPLKVHTPPKGYQLYMTCAVRGCPLPTVTWHLDEVCINSDNNYYITNAYGVCSLYILRVRSMDGGEYKIVAENPLGRAECATKLVVKVAIKKASRLPGVMVRQYVEIVPVGKSTPDFTRKPLPQTIQEGRKAVFKAIVTGSPPPVVTWTRVKCDVLDPEMYKNRYEERAKEHILEDYERICFEFGVTDFRWLLKRLNQMKKEREDEQAKVVENLGNVKQIEVKPNGRAEFELDMKLSDPNSKIDLFKDGLMVPYGMDENSKPRLEIIGTKYVFSIKDPQPEDAGFYQLDVVPNVDFTSKIQNTKAMENEDAIFRCVLSAPLNYITWSTQDASLDHGDKYDIAVSEDKLTHTLTVKGCAMADAGAYFAIAGIMRSSASLTVEDTAANVGDRVELSCKLSSDTAKGCWYKNEKLLTDGDVVKIVKDGACHKLIIDCCTSDDGAVYRFEAEGRKSDATLNVEGAAPLTVQWYKHDEELLPGLNVRMETSSSDSQLRLIKCQRKDGGVVKIKLKNAFSTIEAISKLIVLDKPTPPQGPVDIMESGATSVEFKWKPPKDDGGCPVTGYTLERQQVGRNKWARLGEIPGGKTSYRDSDVDPGRRYCYRIRAKNEEGVSNYLETEDISAGVLRYPGSPSAPKVVSAFKDCINLTWSPPCDTGGTDIVGFNLQKQKKGSNYWSLASPLPEISWLKDGVPVSRRVTITNSDSGSQLLIPTSERLDSGIYTIMLKNMVGHETFSVEIRVTVVLEQNVPGTVTVCWEPSPDEKRDDRLNYMVARKDSFKRTWRTVAENLFNHRCTVTNLLPGQEYYFRVFAKNDMGLSTPTESPSWATKQEKAHFKLDLPESKSLDFRASPSFIVPLKQRTPPRGYECHMSCAVSGDPRPHVTWYRDNVSLNTNTNYHITSVSGVCTLLILKVDPKDTGEYKVVLDNPLGTAECSMMLNVRAISKARAGSQPDPDVSPRESRLPARRRTEEDVGCKDFKKLYEGALAANGRLQSRLGTSREELALVQSQLGRVTDQQV
ncbi:hypothetical protein NHX12_030701 [Muraenolepis orangiensis]|uniref:Immunoglobulin-like and fibronectin type III domain-containing protein 1 n=1 Tax=Muraenolepis orangiensis TaxID=630683 RepID=A0A9Q0EEH3_9TELE|nr:hypothetical protein NHX12_030701 [Muraenolepis orangiensis]